MSQSTVSQKIYSTFFAKLMELPEISQETMDELKTLHEAGQLASKSHIGQLVRNMERRHAQDKVFDS